MRNQTLDYIFKYLRVNGCSFWFNIFQIASTLFMLTLLYLQNMNYVSLIENFIAIMVTIDLLIRFMTEGFQNFAASWDNRIHLMILTLLLASICSDIAAPELTNHDGGIVAGVFLFIRYSVQISRLFRLIIDSKKQLQMAHHQEIILNSSIELQTSERTYTIQ